MIYSSLCGKRKQFFLTFIRDKYSVLSLISVQLLHKLSVRATDGPQKLLRMIKNPVSDHLPPGCPRIATSFSSGEAVCPRTLVPEGPAAVVIGAFAHGAVRDNPICFLFQTLLQTSYVMLISVSLGECGLHREDRIYQ